MASASTGTKKKPDSFALDTRAAAAYIGMSPRTLEKWRSDGVGPSYSRLGGKSVVYVREDLESYVRDRRVGA